MAHVLLHLELDMSGILAACACVMPSLIWATLPCVCCPESRRNWQRIDIELLPPCGLITRAMKLAVMDPANRDSELVAHSVSNSVSKRLGKREVMRIRRRAAAHKTSQPMHELPG